MILPIWFKAILSLPRSLGHFGREINDAAQGPANQLAAVDLWHQPPVDRQSLFFAGIPLKRDGRQRTRTVCVKHTATDLRLRSGDADGAGLPDVLASVPAQPALVLQLLLDAQRKRRLFGGLV